MRNFYLQCGPVTDALTVTFSLHTHESVVYDFCNSEKGNTLKMQSTRKMPSELKSHKISMCHQEVIAASRGGLTW